METEIEMEKTEPKEEGLSGWADSMARILRSNKPKNKKELILSRARKDYEVSKSARAPRPRTRPSDDNLEIVPMPKPKVQSEEEPPAKDDEDKKPAVDDNILSLKLQRKLELKQKKLERAWENLARLTTEKTDPQFERDLVKMATKGVVQLFNAISMQQKTVKSKLKRTRKSEFQKDKVLDQTKDIFDSAMSKSKLMGKEGSGDIKIKEETDDEDFDSSVGRKRKSSSIVSSRDSKKKPAWNALQDNFMLDAKLKDWDQNSDSDSE